MVGTRVFWRRTSAPRLGSGLPFAKLTEIGLSQVMQQAISDYAAELKAEEEFKAAQLREQELANAANKVDVRQLPQPTLLRSIFSRSNTLILKSIVESLAEPRGLE